MRGLWLPPWAGQTRTEKGSCRALVSSCRVGPQGTWGTAPGRPATGCSEWTAKLAASGERESAGSLVTCWGQAEGSAPPRAPRRLHRLRDPQACCFCHLGCCCPFPAPQGASITCLALSIATSRADIVTPGATEIALPEGCSSRAPEGGVESKTFNKPCQQIHRDSSRKQRRGTELPAIRGHHGPHKIRLCALVAPSRSGRLPPKSGPFPPHPLIGG